MSDDNVPHPSGGGYRPDPFDSRDHYYQPKPDTHPADKIDLRLSASAFMTPVYDQGQLESCIAHPTASAFWFEEKRAQQSWGEKGPSRMFLYWLARGGDSETHKIENPSDSGGNPRDAVRGLYRVGICPEEDWEYDVKDQVNKQPPEKAYTNASAHKINRFFRLDPDRPDEDNLKLTTDDKTKIGAHLLNNLKCCLTEGYPVAFGFNYYLPDDQMWYKGKQFTLKDPWAQGWPRNTFPVDLDEKYRYKEGGVWKITGHCVLAIGYDDSKAYGDPHGEKGAVLAQNSWGADWSDGGFFWVPYSWIKDFAATNDFWTIRITDKSQGREAPAPKEPVLWQAVHKSIFGQ